jgi:LAS superfamily LD-carboxypeptidase LdcB
MLPVVAVKKPADLANQRNGKLTPCVLAPVMFAGVGHSSLHPLAKRAWDALVIACHNETGVSLTATSVADAYRTYDRQESLFRRRYRDTYNPLTCSTAFKLWNGVKWWQLRGTAMAAVPGTSNHGWALAVDSAIWTGSANVGINTNRVSWAWMLAHAVEFGWSWEVQSEPWHIRYYAGDNVPKRVLEIEKALAG